MTLRERNMKVHWRLLSIGVVAFGAAMAYRSASYPEGLRHGWDMLIFIVIGVAFAMYAGITSLALHFGLAEYRHSAVIVHATSFIAIGAVFFGSR